MQQRNNGKPFLETDGVVQRVDAINRELVALVRGGLVTIYLPPECEVVLHRERVKLRMIQPRDRVRVTYRELADSLVARKIEVQTVDSFPALSPRTAR